MRQPFSRVFVTGTNVVLLSSLLMGCAVSEGARAGRARDPMGSPAAPAGVARPPAPEPVSQAEFAARRAALARELEDGVFVALGTPTPSHDYLPWAQSSSFRYLTGILEPDAALVMVKEGGRVDELLFVQPRDPAREVWEGRRLGPEGAAALTGIRALPRPELAAVLDSILGGAAAAPVGSTDGGAGRGEASERSDASGAADGSAGRPIRLYTLVPVPPGPRPLQPLSPEQQFLARIVADRPWLEVVPVPQGPGAEGREVGRGAEPDPCGRAHHGARAPAGDGRDRAGDERIRAPGADRVHVPAQRRGAAGVRLDRRLGPERDDVALQRERSVHGRG